MAGKGSTFENGFLRLIFQATPMANIADNAATSPLTNLYVSLHTADPTAAGNQTSSEVAYTGYARVAVARSSSGWTVTANSVSPAANVQFPACTAGTATATNWSVGSASTGTGQIFYTGTLSPSISIANGVTPIITTASTITES